MKSSSERYHDGLLGFLAGTAISTTLAITYLQHKNKKSSNNNNNNKNDSNENSNDNTSKSLSTLPFPPSFREEQLSRTSLYFPKTLKKITDSKVIIVGLGGVGSHCAYMLARSGVGNLRLIDFDQVTLSSLNRHAVATLEDVGFSKVGVVRSAISKVIPSESYCRVDARRVMYTGNLEVDGCDLLEGDWDMVIDAIDDVSTKAALVADCVRRGLKVVTCMGAGGKSDPTRLHIGDLKASSGDPLATKVRQRLKKMGGKDLMESELIHVVYSSEKTVMPLAQLTEDQQKKGVNNFGAIQGMRVRVLPVLGTMPAIMGQTCAAFALCNIGEKPFMPVVGERVGRLVRHRLFQHLRNREQKIKEAAELKQTHDNTENQTITTTDIQDAKIINSTWVGPLQIDMDDMEYIISHVWRNRCAVSGERLGTVLDIVRWDLTKPSTCDNIVMLGVKALKAFDKTGVEGVDPLIRATIEAKLKTCTNIN